MEPYTLFFPGPAFGWTFVSLLLAGLVPASYIDTRRLVIPKWLTLPMLAAGLAFNLARGVTLGAGGLATWHLGAGGPAIGALDGLLFSLAGLVTGFLLFFALWAMGTCGGGDVKLFAALGAWVGPYLAICILVGTIVLVAGIVAAKFAWRVALGPASRNVAGAGVRDRIVSFSLPVSIVTAALVLWSFQRDLRLEPGPTVTSASPEHGAR